MTPSPKTAAERQAERKARQLAAGLVLWKRWVHPGDVLALSAAADKLARRRELESKRQAVKSMPQAFGPERNL